MALPKMIDDGVLILPDEVKEDETFVNPSGEKPKACTGKVIAVGNGFHAEDTGLLIPMEVKVGDHVKYKWRLFDDFEFEGVNYVNGIEKNIICIF